MIRKLSADDITSTLLIVLSNLSKVDLQPEEAKKLHTERETQGIVMYGYFEDEELLGTLSLILERKLIHSGGLCGHIEDVSVHSGQTGKGIGQALVRHAIQEAKKAGCYKVILDCSEDLIPFYSKCGLRKAGVCMRFDTSDLLE
jgi:glucosamine-phosphate N-acetyltransferase